MFSSVAIAKTLGTFLISTFANHSIATKKQWFAIVKFAKSLGTKFLKIEHQTEKILRNKTIHTDLNLWAINLKFFKILSHVVYNLYKFQIDGSQIEAWAAHETEYCFVE